MTFHRLARRRGKQKAVLAVAHSVLVILYHVLRDHHPYSDRLERRYVHQLERLGQLFAQCAVPLVALHLLRHYTSRGDLTAALPSTTHTLSARQLQRVIDCIQDQPGRQLTLGVLADQTGFSPSYFARLFRRTTGETPHQCVLRLRLERAQQQLAATELSLAHIAGACGFADQSSFTRAFKRALGVTPRAYRRERRI